MANKYIELEWLMNPDADEQGVFSTKPNLLGWENLELPVNSLPKELTRWGVFWLSSFCASIVLEK